jgi:hypothetical protein
MFSVAESANVQETSPVLVTFGFLNQMLWQFELEFEFDDLVADLGVSFSRTLRRVAFLRALCARQFLSRATAAQINSGPFAQGECIRPWTMPGMGNLAG